MPRVRSLSQADIATAALSIIDRHIRLMGLDAPTEISIHTPTQHEIERWVDGVAQGGASDLLAPCSAALAAVATTMDFISSDA